MEALSPPTIMPLKRFKVAYTNGKGERVLEEPRQVLTADGMSKALILGEDTVLAILPLHFSDGELWAVPGLSGRPLRA